MLKEIHSCSFSLLLLFAACHPFVSLADTASEDVGALAALSAGWKNTPPSWGKGDPCGAKWEGVDCENSRVISLKLSSMGLQGQITDVGSLTQLQVLDLSLNGQLVGSIPASIGKITNLRILILSGCNFTGNIPDELGNLGQLAFLALNSNKLMGKIPSSLGKLSNIYWLDIADNMLSGPLPVSSDSSPGLDMLLKAKHFHFNRNQLSGSISPQLFSSGMVLIHILLDGNKFNGEIPSSIGLVSTLEVLRLDRNSFSGSVPTSLGNLRRLNELNLAVNQLTGPIPDLTNMSNLNYVDLSNNTFDASISPSWFTSIQSLTTLTMQFGTLGGKVPSSLFNLPSLQKVVLKYNSFNETLDMGNSTSPQLQVVDLEYNKIPSITLGNSYDNTLLLIGNPVCQSTLANTRYCMLPAQTKPYSTSLANCLNASCPADQRLNPQSCGCAYPYEGNMHFRAPLFSDLTNSTPFQALEHKLWTNFGLTPGSVFLQNPYFDSSDYMVLYMAIFPSIGMYFKRSDILQFGFQLTNQTFKPPHVFGPYYFVAIPYPFHDASGGKSFSTGAIIGIAVGCGVLILALLALGIYAVRQKKRAERAITETQPFASWGVTSSKDIGEAPQLKGAKWFSYDEVKKCTNNFSSINEIGSGGYGKVYRGSLPSGQIVAIKRARQGSMQGGAEFKTEIELLSRVHHKNLVALVGFCFDRGEQMLVYEFIPNGTLRDCLYGRSGIYIDWNRRLRIALGSARGLAYLHELADPPIIHRDVKSTNILLDERLTSKVSDFGLSKLVSDTSKGHVSTQVKGTLGYMDPDYYMTQQLSEKSDVYSFGVVLFELISGKQPIERGKYIVREVRSAIDRSKELYGLRELVDPSIRTSMLSGFEKFVDLALRCVEESSSDRPTMGDVVKEIETILQNEGVNTNPASASSSATDFGANKSAPHHPYNEPLTSKENSDAFSVSGGYTLTTNVEPK